MEKIFQGHIAGYELEVHRHENGSRFTVRYGQQIKRNLDYKSAAHKLGECIFHGMQCEGKLD